MPFSIERIHPTPEAATAEALREAGDFIEAVLRNSAGLDNAQRMLLGEAEGNLRRVYITYCVAHRAPAATRVVYRSCEQWGDASFESLEELEAAIRVVCANCASRYDDLTGEDIPDFIFPEDGLREGRDYTIETEE